MKETKNVPQLRFSGFDDEWEEKKLGECFKERTQRSAIGELISVTISSGVKKASELERHDSSSEDKSNYKCVYKGDIAYNSMRMWQGASGVSNFDGILSPAYTVCIPDDNTDSVFFSYMFKIPKIVHTFEINSQGLTKDTWNLKFPAFSLISINATTLAEQQKIGTFLSHVDSLIQAKTKKLESLKAVKKSLLQKCFPKAGEKVPEMRFTGFSGDWEEKNLGEVAEISSGTTPSRMNSENFSGDVCWLTSGELKSHYIYDTSEKINESIAETMRTYKNGTVVIAIYGLEAAGIRGTCSILKRDCTISQACMAFTNLKSVHNEFLYCWYIANGNEIGTKYAQGTKQQNLSSDIVSDMSICFPTLAEQQKIGQFFSKYDSLISAQQKEINKLKDIKKSLLQKMFV